MRSVSQSFGLRRKHAAMAPLKRPPNDGRRMMAELLAVLRGLVFRSSLLLFFGVGTKSSKSQRVWVRLFNSDKVYRGASGTGGRL
jgi:hypothetical protein